jgi:hypothetical protein
MKKLLASASFVALMAASGSAYAVNFGIATVVNSQCHVANDEATQTRTFTLDDTGAVPAGGATPIFNQTATCTGPAKVQVKSLNGVIAPGGAPAPYGVVPPPGFANRLHYSATATWSTLSATANANNLASPVIVNSATATATAFTGPLLITYSTPGTAGLPLVAGSYSDTLIVTLIAS